MSDSRSGSAATNLRAAIRRDHERIKEVQRRQVIQEKVAAAGGVLLEEITGGDGVMYARVTFEEKPGYTVIDALKAAGYWLGRGHWCGPLERLPACVRDLVNDNRR